MLTESIKSAIVSHAERTLDQEVCGFVMKNGEVRESPNLHPEPDKAFMVDGKLYAAYTGNIAAIYHSHCSSGDNGYLSFGDISQSKFFGIPYLVYHVIDKAWDLFDPHDLNPFPLLPRRGTPNSTEFYLDWIWDWGRSDCYTLLRNWMRGHNVTDMPEFERSPNPLEYLQEGWDRYRDNMPSLGFREIELDAPLQKHDVVCMAIKSDTPHHIGVISVVDQRNGKANLVHHIGHPRLSEEVVFGAMWQDFTRIRWRHESLWRLP